jgi:intergrase/recombinase
MSISLSNVTPLMGGRSLAWLGHRLPKPYSHDLPLVLNQTEWNQFTEWVRRKYSKTHAPNILSLTKRFNHLLYGNLRDIETIPVGIRNNTIKSLIVLAKFLGIHQESKSRLRDYGVKMVKQDAFASFIRIYNNNSSDLPEWYHEAFNILRPNEQTLLKLLVLSGVRKEEGITAFNKIRELGISRIHEYYDNESRALEHFRHKELFLRTTKNVYVSIIPESLVLEICNSQIVTYPAILKRLRHDGLRCRLNELRDYFGTFMVRHGLIREEVDLLQGRIPPSIFVRHYWSPSFKELRDRTLKAISELEQTLN